MLFQSRIFSSRYKKWAFHPLFTQKLITFQLVLQGV